MKKTKNIIFIAAAVAAVILLAVIPMFIVKNGDFGGADGKAEEAISTINADYKPWFESIWEPPSGEIESLLFALQAALGAGFIGFYIGYVRGKASHKKQTEAVSK